jgi:predicted metal-dependent hydrolase
VGQYHRVIFEPTASARRPKINNGTITIYLEVGEAIADTVVQVRALTYVKKALRLEAKNYLPERLDELAKLANLQYSRLSLKDLRSRWGSCSSKRNINLNIRLMNLPSRLIDHVIFHELAHLEHMGHGADFWKLLESLDGKGRIHNQELKRFDIRPTRMS